MKMVRRLIMIVLKSIHIPRSESFKKSKWPVA